ncbi:efflux RND transporter periplasmic adaptor subunit [Hydrogenophaga intermedia]|uniref:Transmembrane multidrug efflux system transmembrane protein n=1 Tax=Hydrogenophaga intermedia TaxID=65786 RepID=A0A1L1PFF8_HYDIT|nr:efflux RND transporter periplasmic adaptor subunit [Hydrogenophaga intermedia]TMU74462.1 efflux RND transporter periplasmic adaptor subunit [Hydrogenophaga intermedia]CDN88802.1 Transmembrane multidrug efflux system transmembrane protein [Hydrogenophaga intermedia]
MPAIPSGRTLALAVLFPLLLPVLQACGGPADAQGGPPPAMPVSVAPAVQRSVTDVETFSGRLEAAEFVELRPRVAGTIDKVHFTDGATVAAGALLFTIDPRPFEAEVARAESQVVAAKSRADLAQTEYARAQKLLDSRAVSRQEFDQLAAGARTSEADIKAAEAALRVARLNLAYTAVRAPIGGRLSRANVTAGNLVNEQVVLTSIAATNRVHAYFDGSEQTFLRVRAAGNAKPVVRLGLANEEGYPHQGTLDFVDNRLNPQTGAIRLRASFDNRDGRFVPGLAARLTMTTSAPYQATLVPERAIGTDQNRKTVVVVGQDGQPQFRVVQLGALQDGMRVVLGDAVKPGENVVVEGLQRIMPGVPVQPQVLKVDERGMPIAPPPAAPQQPAK